MKKVFLFGTAILMATSVLAFGGGGKSRKSSVYRGTGVDSIDVHINGKNGDSCPAEKKCGDGCCQADNVCKQDAETGEFQCCNDRLCCSVGQTAYCPISPGCFGPSPKCCDGTVYVQRQVEGSTQSTLDCCATPGVVFHTMEKEGEYTQGCCTSDLKLAKDKDQNGNEYYICGNCVSNADCKENEYCKLTGEIARPSYGICSEIGSYTDSSEQDTVTGILGIVRVSNTNMTWWSADNWCKAQGMNLIDTTEFECYESGTNQLVTEGDPERIACCAGNNVECFSTSNWYNGDTRAQYSHVLNALREVFGTKYLWVSSHKLTQRACMASYVRLEYGCVDAVECNYEPGNWVYALCR